MTKQKTTISDQDRRDLLNFSLGYAQGVLLRIKALARRNAPQAEIERAIDEGIQPFREWAKKLGLHGNEGTEE